MKIKKVTRADNANSDRGEGSRIKIKQTRYADGAVVNHPKQDQTKSDGVKIKSAMINGHKINYSVHANNNIEADNNLRIISKHEFMRLPGLQSRLPQRRTPVVNPNSTPDNKQRHAIIIKNIAHLPGNERSEELYYDTKREYEIKAQQIAEEIMSKSRSKNECISNLYMYFLEHCKYWDGYPHSRGFIPDYAPFQYVNSKGETVLLQNDAMDYTSEECTVLAGYSVCRGMACAFKDICNKMGIDCETVSTDIHKWNMIYTDKGPRYIDLSQAVKHFRSVENIEGTIIQRGLERDRQLAKENFLVENLIDSYYSHDNGMLDINEREAPNPGEQEK